MDNIPANAPAPSHWTSRLAVKLHRYKNLLQRRWWILFLTLCIALAYQSFVLFKKPEMFTSFGKMMVSGKVDTKEQASYSEDLQNFYGTQIEIMQSEDVMGRARRRLALESPNLQGDAYIIASQTPRTSIFTLQGTGTNPDYTQRFVDAVMSEFVSYKRDKRQETTDSTMVQISEELTRLRRELDDREKELNAFIEANNMAFWEEQSNTSAKFLSDLKTQQADLTKELRLLENLTEDQLLSRPAAEVPRAIPVAEGSAPQPGTPSAVPDTSMVGAGDLQTQFLLKRQELVQRQSEVEELGKVLKPRHPKLVRMKEEVTSLERLLGVIRDQSREGTQARIASIKAELSSVAESIASWEEKTLEASKKGAEYKRLQGSVARTKELYDGLLSSIQNLDISKNIGQETIQVMQAASPAHKVPPKVLLNLALGLLMGFGVGAGLLVLLDRADDRLTSFTEINEQFSLPVLGQIPNVTPRGQKVPTRTPPLRADDDRYMFAEAFRNLRSSLVFMPGQQQLQTLLVTSSIPGEGKSTITANLAVTMAFAGARVLLVDADLKRGDMAKMFSVDGRFGFSSVLRGDASWQTISQPTAYENLTLLPRGPIMSQPAELLLQPTLEAFMQEVRAAYDLIIFNSAPILATDDTTTLAPNIDGCLMVVRAFVTSARLAENSLNALHQRQAKILGLILNSVNTEMSDYYHYRYSQYYSKA